VVAMNQSFHIITEFLNMGYEQKEAEKLYHSQEKLFVGAKVGILVNHHTDELLLEAIKENQLDLNQLTVSRIEWKNGQVFFENAEGSANIFELKL
jgi:hypothetical protein